MISTVGISIEEFRSWNDLEELRLVCNAVKHAEGGSAKALEKIRPDLFSNDFYPLLTSKQTVIKLSTSRTRYFAT